VGIELGTDTVHRILHETAGGVFTPCMHGPRNTRLLRSSPRTPAPGVGGERCEASGGGVII
jgi:hypothetical protein